jgi:hypothetical protein
LTVIVNGAEGPTQLLACGVTVNVPAIGADPVFIAVKDEIELPEPLAPMPIDALLLVQA